MIEEKQLTVAILPFVNVSNHPTVDELGRLIAEALDERLTHNEVLKVKANSEYTTGQDDVHVRDIGRAFGADVVLFGCIRQTDELVRVWVQFICGQTGCERWSTSVKRMSGDTNRDGLAEAMASELVHSIQLDFRMTAGGTIPCRHPAEWTRN